MRDGTCGLLLFDEVVASLWPAMTRSFVPGTKWYCGCMLTEYLQAAMRKAHYELLGGGEGYYGDIPGFQGVYAQANTLEGCRDELASTLEDWLLFRISRHLPIPVVDGLNLTVR